MKLLSLGLIAAAALLSVSLEAAPLQRSVLSAIDPIKEMTSTNAHAFFQQGPDPSGCGDCLAAAQVDASIYCLLAWLYGGEAAYNECVQNAMAQCIWICFPGFNQDGIKRQPFKTNPLVQYAPVLLEVPMLR